MVVLKQWATDEGIGISSEYARNANYKAPHQTYRIRNWEWGPAISEQTLHVILMHAAV